MFLKTNIFALDNSTYRIDNLNKKSGDQSYLKFWIIFGG